MVASVIKIPIKIVSNNRNVFIYTATMVENIASASSKSFIPAGPLFDDGAPFSPISITELRLLRHVDRLSSIQLDPKQSSLASY